MGKKPIKIILITLFSLTFLLCSSVQYSQAAESLVFHNVTFEVGTNAQDVPTLTINIDYVENTVLLDNVTLSATNHSYIIFSASNDQIMKTGDMDFSIIDESWSKTILLSDLTNGDYYFGLNFTDNDVAESYNYTTFDKSKQFTVSHNIAITYLVDPDADFNTIDIKTKLTCTYSGFSESYVSTAKYYVYRDGLQVKSGDLTYQSDPEFNYIATGVSLKGLGSATYSVYVEFNVPQFGGIVDTEDEMSSAGHSIIRDKPFEDLVFIIVLVIVAVTVIIIVVIVVARRGTGNVEKRKKPKEEGPIEVFDIKSGGQKIDAKKLKPKKEKGKTVANKDLIFSVPQWEEEDLDDEETTFTETKNSAATKSAYLLHCSACNSWVEIDDYVAANCPKCDHQLSLAMYCPKDDKWFDVPEPGNYKCPICSTVLKYSDA